MVLVENEYFMIAVSPLLWAVLAVPLTAGMLIWLARRWRRRSN